VGEWLKLPITGSTREQSCLDNWAYSIISMLKRSLAVQIPPNGRMVSIPYHRTYKRAELLRQLAIQYNIHAKRECVCLNSPVKEWLKLLITRPTREKSCLCLLQMSETEGVPFSVVRRSRPCYKVYLQIRPLEAGIRYLAYHKNGEHWR